MVLVMDFGIWGSSLRGRTCKVGTAAADRPMWYPGASGFSQVSLRLPMQVEVKRRGCTRPRPWPGEGTSLHGRTAGPWLVDAVDAYSSAAM